MHTSTSITVAVSSCEQETLYQVAFLSKVQYGGMINDPLLQLSSWGVELWKQELLEVSLILQVLQQSLKYLKTQLIILSACSMLDGAQ